MMTMMKVRILLELVKSIKSTMFGLLFGEGNDTRGNYNIRFRYVANMG